MSGGIDGSLSFLSFLLLLLLLLLLLVEEAVAAATVPATTVPSAVGSAPDAPVSIKRDMVSNEFKDSRDTGCGIQTVVHTNLLINVQKLKI